MRIESKDLWQSAYVLAKGGELEDVRVDGNGGHGKMAIFVLRGPPEDYLNHYIKTLRLQRTSERTIEGLRNDIGHFFRFLKEKGIHDIRTVTKKTIATGSPLALIT